MDSEYLKYKAPRTLDAMPKMFIWDFDVALTFITVMGLGISLGGFFIPMILAFIACAGLQKMKSGRHPGYMVHLLYWYSPTSIGNRRTPPSFARDFIG
jgi:conjugal transfer pilus assembly protein TraL